MDLFLQRLQLYVSQLYYRHGLYYVCVIIFITLPTGKGENYRFEIYSKLMIDCSSAKGECAMRNSSLADLNARQNKDLLQTIQNCSEWENKGYWIKSQTPNMCRCLNASANVDVAITFQCSEENYFICNGDSNAKKEVKCPGSIASSETIITSTDYKYPPHDTDATSKQPNPHTQNQTGMMIGVAVGALLFGSVVTGLSIFIFLRKRRNSSRREKRRDRTHTDGRNENVVPESPNYMVVENGEQVNPIQAGNTQENKSSKSVYVDSPDFVYDELHKKREKIQNSTTGAYESFGTNNTYDDTTNVKYRVFSVMVSGAEYSDVKSNTYFSLERQAVPTPVISPYDSCGKVS